MASKRKELKLQKAEYSKRVRELGEIRSQLECAYSAFDSVSDPDMTDVCIFEIHALRSRYNYALINLRKTQ